MKMNWRVWIPVALILTLAAFTEQSASAQHAVGKEMDVPADKSHLYAVPLAPLKKFQPGSQAGTFGQAAGIPFLLSQPARLKPGSPWTVPLRQRVRRIFLAGFTITGYNQGQFIGQQRGTLVLNYADGKTVRYPLIYGYNLWCRPSLMRQYPQPFASNAVAREVLQRTLAVKPIHMYGVPESQYLAAITPRPAQIKDIQVVANQKYAHVPAIMALTVRCLRPVPPTWLALPHDRSTADAKRWLKHHAMQPQAQRETKLQAAFRYLCRVLYTSRSDFPARLPVDVPADYPATGPRVRFRGNVYADILTSVFYNDVADALKKIGRHGMFHTSTPGAPNWSSYTGDPMWRDGLGVYSGQAWGRDMGRTMQELTELGFLRRADRVADFCFREARRWAKEPQLRFKGARCSFWNFNPSSPLWNQLRPKGREDVQLPPHWCRVINIPNPTRGAGVFENDAQGMIMLFTYKLWQRQAHPNTWMHRHWKDILAAGNWIGWQLDHPSISGSRDGVLMTDSECANGAGQAKYADVLCEQALRAYAAMAASIGQTAVAKRWQATAGRLFQGIEKVYFTTDRWGPNWTLRPAGWGGTTNLGPLIIMADSRGLAPRDNPPGWRIRDLNAYRRFIHSASPFGFYGRNGMGYGQGFVTQAALLLDRMRQATVLLRWFARMIYFPGAQPYITPESCVRDRSGRYWHRVGDLGNGVQEGETIKTLLLVIGVGDDSARRTQLLPRLPLGWSAIRIKDYPLLTVGGDGRRVLRHISYHLRRLGNELTLGFTSDKPVALMNVRLGPFVNSAIRAEVNGHPVAPRRLRVRQSGDSYWVWLPTMRSVERFQAEVWGQPPTLGNGRSGRW